MKDGEKLIKGIIYKSTIEKAPKFTDLIGEGIAKLDEGIFIKFWDDGSMHQSKLSSLKNPKDPYFFSMSLNGAKVDTYDLDRLPADYKKYKSDLLIKATKALKDSLKKDSNMKIKDSKIIYTAELPEDKSFYDVERYLGKYVKVTYGRGDIMYIEVDDKYASLLRSELIDLDMNFKKGKYTSLDSLKKDSNMKKYKIGNRIITADSATKALEIHKLLDARVKDGLAADLVKDLKSRFPGIQLHTESISNSEGHWVEINVSSYGDNNKKSVDEYISYLKKKYSGANTRAWRNVNGVLIRENDSICDGYYSEYDKKDKEFVKMALSEMKRYERNWSGMSSQDKRNVGCTLGELRKRIKELEEVKDSISDESIEELSEEERQAIEDYKKAIAETNDPKMLKLFAHILKEETEHLEELQSGEMEDSLGNDIKKYQEWVDYDMKKYGRISEKTNRELDKAGLEVVKDKYGSYEVIARD